ncbi:uncharacterized protein LOC133795087 [Humulus lupulus]|uniref:uncharacterized protein LOC133795087 n=1 Tax=Humulus lupulus TaxID=3486 RepID=UPI002B409D89|nr:uncharacterized protein LOC133795087 [Humulus lupulus]
MKILMLFILGWSCQMLWDFTNKPEFSSVGLSFEEVYVDPEILSVIDRTVQYAEGEKKFTGSKDDWKVVMVGDDDEVPVAIEKREPKPSTHVKSPFVTEFGSSDVKETVKRKGVEVVIVRGLVPFENEIGQNVSKNDCLDYISWIEDKMNFKNKKKKFSDVNNIINPPMDYSFVKISEKMWFYKLQTCGEELMDTHINVCFYYLRKKIKLVDGLNKRVTTTDSWFDATIKGLYDNFVAAKCDSSIIRFDNLISDYIIGEYLFCNTPWVDVDHVFFPVHVKVQLHWVFIHFSIKSRMLTVYNSLTGKKNESIALPYVKAYSVVLPYFLDFLDFYCSRKDLDLNVGPYSVGKKDPIDFNFAKYLSFQEDNDCGVFVIKYADLFIHGKIDDIPKNMTAKIATYRDYLAINLYSHAKKKQIGGYKTEDDAPSKKSKRRRNYK